MLLMPLYHASTFNNQVISTGQNYTNHDKRSVDPFGIKSRGNLSLSLYKSIDIEDITGVQLGGSRKKGTSMVVRQTNLLLHQWANQAGLITSQDQFVDIYGLDPDVSSGSDGDSNVNSYLEATEHHPETN